MYEPEESDYDPMEDSVGGRRRVLEQPSIYSPDHQSKSNGWTRSNQQDNLDDPHHKSESRLLGIRRHWIALL